MLLLLLVLLLVVVMFYWLYRRNRRVDLTGKTVLVSGVSFGNIGMACAVEAAACGASHIFLLSFKAARTNEVCGLVSGAAKGRACVLTLIDDCDLSSEAGVDSVIEATLKKVRSRRKNVKKKLKEVQGIVPRSGAARARSKFPTGQGESRADGDSVSCERAELC